MGKLANRLFSRSTKKSSFAPIALRALRQDCAKKLCKKKMTQTLTQNLFLIRRPILAHFSGGKKLHNRNKGATDHKNCNDRLDDQGRGYYIFLLRFLLRKNPLSSKPNPDHHVSSREYSTNPNRPY